MAEGLQVSQVSLLFTELNTSLHASHPQRKILIKRSHVPIKIAPVGKPTTPLPEAPPWAPEAHLSEGMLPEVGQAGVVPQCFCEGLCPFIPNLIAPHPESRGKQWTVTQPHLHLKSAAPLDSLSAGNCQRGDLGPSLQLHKQPALGSQLQRGLKAAATLNTDRQADQQVVWFETSLSELCKCSSLRPSANNCPRK